MWIDIDKLTRKLVFAIDNMEDIDGVKDSCDALLEAMNDEPLFALAVILAARKYNN